MKKQLEDQIKQNQEEMENMKKTWQERMHDSSAQNAVCVIMSAIDQFDLTAGQSFGGGGGKTL